jgi:hypothetical protein
VFVFQLRFVAGLVLPGESKDHSAAGCHNTDNCEDQADKRQPKIELESQCKMGIFLTHIKRQMAPALLLVASMRICKRGPAADVVTCSMFPATNRRTIKNMEPVTVPMPTQETIIFGPSISAFGTSEFVLH